MLLLSFIIIIIIIVNNSPFKTHWLYIDCSSPFFADVYSPVAQPQDTASM